MNAAIVGILVIALIATIILHLYWRKQLNRTLEIFEIDSFLKQQELNSAETLLSTQDKASGRIFSEIHDTLGSILVALNMYADSLIARSGEKQLNDISSRISSTSRQASEMVRKISSALDDGLVKNFALEMGVRNILEAIEKSRGIKTELEIQLKDKIANEVALKVYKMIQELIRNSLQHSKCSLINLDIQSNREVTIIYEDNGVGFDQSAEHQGEGLRNLELAVEELNGELKIDAMPERGSTFIIELPT